MVLLTLFNSLIPLPPSHHNTKFCSTSHHLSSPLVHSIRPFKNLSSNFSLPTKKAKAVHLSPSNSSQQGNDDDLEFQVLTAIKTNYNDIVIVDTAKSRMLLLDGSQNIHSIFNKDQQNKWTGSYWDEFAALPAIVPNGTIAMLGLGGGTAAHLMLDLWPSLQIEGWEIDQILIDKAREFLGLSNLETHNQVGGILDVRIGDALSLSDTVRGGYAGIVVDLFSGGKVLPELEKVETWLEMKNKLMPNGRIMVNCGAANDESIIDATHDPTWEHNSTIKALDEAFHGELCWKKLPKRDGENYLALTGSLPDLELWAAALPDQLCSGVRHWRTC